MDNYFNKETGQYHYQGEVYDDAASYSNAVQANRAEQGLGGSGTSASETASSGTSNKLSNVEKILVDKYGWTDRGDGSLIAKSTGEVYDHEAGTSFEERHGLAKDYTPSSSSTTDLESTSTTNNQLNNQLEVPKMHVEFQRDANGNIEKDANGKNIVISFGVKYADGTISYTGAGREGVLEAERQRSQVKEYNKYVNDDRTREDFESDEAYNHHMIVKNIRIGQGSYKTITDLNGNSTLYAPGNIVVASGTAEQVKNEYRTRSNKLNLALTKAQSKPSITPFGVRYMMEEQGYASEKDVYKKLYQDYKNRGQDLQNILNNWGNLAVDQNLVGGAGSKFSNEMSYLYGIAFPTQTTQYQDFDTEFEAEFENFKTKFTLQDDPTFANYEEWYKVTLGGGQPKEEEVEEDTRTITTDTSTGTTTPGTGTDTGAGTGTGTTTPEVVIPDRTNTGSETTTSGGFETFVQSPVATPTSVPGFQDESGKYPGAGTTNVAVSAPASAVPGSVTTYSNYTGTTMPNLTSQSQGGYGGQVLYINKATGQQMMISVDADGNPTVYVPPGFVKSETNVAAARGGVIGMAEGGDVQLARKFLGFDGPASQLENFLQSSPAAAARMGKYKQAMSQMAPKRMGAQGGTDTGTVTANDVNPAVGSTIYDENAGTGETSLEQFGMMQQNLVNQTMQPMQANVAQIKPESADFIGDTAGQAYTLAPMQDATSVGTVSTVNQPDVADVSTYDPATAAEGVKTATQNLTPVTGTLGDKSQVTAKEQKTSAVSDLDAETGSSVRVADAQGPGGTVPTRTLDTTEGASELISGSAVDQGEVGKAFGTGEVQAASVQDELSGLMQQFEGGETPAWAAGAMRGAMAQLAARGLGASSMAGQAVIQAAMESALPIAQIDAANKQQTALFKAQKRAEFLQQDFDQEFQTKVMNAAKVSEIANMNFTAEQQIALENSRAANTMELQNLSNKQALVMAEAAALSQLDMANLNNRQQAAVQNAQNFLQMDMANLNNEQQTSMFKAQQVIQSLFTDQAAENAAAQFNASSENQSNQFFANLSTQVGQYNASQTNAMNQFNANASNAMKQFNSEIQQQRDLFNAQNGLVVAQANAQWRQNIATLNTAAQNESNMDFAKTINALTSTNLDQIWQRERDIMSYAFTADESALDRALKIVMSDKDLQKAREAIDGEKDAAKTQFGMRFLFGTSPDGILGGLF